MNESIIIQKMISIGQHLEREEIFYSGAESDARALLEEIKQALTIPVVVGQSEQLKAEVFTLANKLAVAGEGDAAVAMHRIHNRI